MLGVPHADLVRFFEGFPFKWVVQIRIESAQPGNQTRCQIQGDEGRPPAFVLADVDMFMVSTELEATRILPPDHMAERHRPGGAAPWQSESQQPGDDPAVNLEHAAYNSQRAALDQDDRNNPESQQRSG